MAVTRRVHVVKPRPTYKTQLPCPNGGEYAQLYEDEAVSQLLATLTPAERIVGIELVKDDNKQLIYVFTESFGLGPI